ncbi:TetR/AcrR family transcriptional regulator [Streptomyces sp. CA-111067]|uniref:TetR/AcrR family transcriptional regulator n=1 Tax=Streptomyces sp. CA-111067 TaxID=3240046 RepID=UPI003D9695ED
MAETATPRERYRTQVRAEVKERAWEQIASAGASALSLNAIAKQMGMSGPALYRYFAGRDELITELIRDAYRSLADTFVAAAASAADPAPAPSGPDPVPDPGPSAPVPGPSAPVPDPSGAGPASVPGPAGTDPGAVLTALARSLRAWALADPHRYFLIYGTPVPGYHAPEDITGIAREIMTSLLDAVVGLPATAPATPFAVHLETHRPWAEGHPAPASALHRALTFWTRLHGVLSLELAGHFTGMGFDPGLLYAAELDALLTGAETV